MATPRTEAEDLSAVSSESHSAHQLSDPAELRRLRNAEYVGVTVRTTIPQRFEMYDPRTEQDLADLKAMGFTQVILDRPQLHTAASSIGLDVVLANWWTQETKPEEIQQGLKQARAVAPDRLIGFSVMDEPGRNAPETPFGFYIDLYNELKPEFEQKMPGTRLEISHWGPMAGWDQRYYDYFSYLYEAADVMRIMPYPDLSESPLDDVFFMVQRSRRMMEIAQRELPLVVILQAWLLPPNGRLPEIDELRVMALQAMLSGAQTLSFFEYNVDIWSRTPGFRDQFRSLMLELTSFSHRYRNYCAETAMTAHGILNSTLRSPTGAMTRITVNTRRYDVGTLQPLEVRETTLRSHRSCRGQVTSAQPRCDAVPVQYADRCRVYSSFRCNLLRKILCRSLNDGSCR
ncbi:MAG: hypothetical protein MK102_09115 [Fuerstiella sp.]|nr:hypothetical protein [Fuerstiella sp.]